MDGIISTIMYNMYFLNEACVNVSTHAKWFE